MKNWNKYPLAILLLLSSILFAAAGLAGRHTVYASYDRQDIMTPSLALVFQGWKDGIYPWDLLQASEAEDVFNDEPEIAGNDAPAAEPEQFISGNSLLQDQLETVRGAGENIVPDVSGNGTILPNTLAPVKESETDGGTDSGVLAAAGSLSDNQISVTDGTDQTAESGNPTDGADAFEKENGQIGEHISEEAVLPEQQEDQTYEFTAVGEDYFSDALFIGDSRTVGLQEYGKIDQAQYYAATSLTIYNVFQKPKKVAVLDGKKMTIEEALGQKQYKKIYLMLGINELGTGSVEYFIKAYADVIIRIRQMQPDAILFVQGIMRVGGEKHATDSVFNNTRINERNAALSMFADNKNIFYLEVNDAVCDENGNLVDGYTFDQIHLKAKYYQLWKDYLLVHGIVK